MHRPLFVAIDYSVLDHLFRVDAGTYTGKSADELRKLSKAAAAGTVRLWMSEIARVEMLLGRENLASKQKDGSHAAANDAKKDALAIALNIGRLGYPCSKLDDTYSRLDMSFRLSDAQSDTWARADAFEKRMAAVSGIDPGDARHIACLAFPFDGDAPIQPVRLDWYVAEDALQLAALRTLNPPELSHLRLGSVAELVSAAPATFAIP